MGWSWRKSLSFGPFRLNFSRSGIGASVGVPGARVSTGSRGTYIHVGAGGFRYSKRLDDRSPAVGRQTQQPQYSVTPRGHLARTVEQVDLSQMADSTPDELFEEIQAKWSKRGLVKPLLVVAACFFFFALQGFNHDEDSQLLGWTGVALGSVAVLGLPWAFWWERCKLTTRIDYAFDELGTQVNEAIDRLVQALQRAHAIWSVQVEEYHGDWKRNAGAGTSVQRRGVTVGWSSPPRIVTNVRVGTLVVGRTRLHLLPDRILAYADGEVCSIPYGALTLKPGRVSFIETESIPRDAIVLGSTWRFVRKDGGPDRRFNNNYQVPIVQYDVLDVSAPVGLQLRLQLSTAGLAEGSAKLLQLVQEAITHLQRQGAGIQPKAPPARLVVDDPPPLAVPVAQAFRFAVAALEFHWLSALPSWGIPIFWGLVFAMPTIAAMFVFFHGWNSSNGIFLGFALFLAGCGAPVLIGEHTRAAAARRDAAKNERQSRFRAVLTSELRTKPADKIDFDDLVANGGLKRDEADAVADELYRLMVVRVVADGVISPKEERTLRSLAQALKMSSDRCEVIEAEAKSTRYHEAVSAALDDGVVTPQEARMLEELRTHLGVADVG